MVDPEPVKQEVNACFGVENPSPSNACDNERECVGKQKDVPQDRMTNKLSIQEHGQSQAKKERPNQEKGCKDEHVPEAGVPARHREHLLVGEAEWFTQIEVHAQGTPF